MKFLLLLIICLCAPRTSSVHAETLVGGFDYGVVAIRLPPLLRTAVDIVDYGAKCDGITDDSPAINQAIDVWRRQQMAQRSVSLIFPAHGSCLITHPINLTNVFHRGALIIGNGATILCETGSICIDATGAAGIDLSNLIIRATKQNMPKIGIQWARENAKSGCTEDNNTSLVISGYFSFAAIYIEACEDMSWTNTYIENDYTAGSAWLVVEDGVNHWNAQSPFQNITIGDKPHGMDELVWTNPIFFQKGPGHMMWLANSHSTELIGEAYGNSNYGAAPFVLYEQPQANNGNLVIQMHFEERGQDSVFDLEGPEANPTINGLTWHERGSQALRQIFAHGPMIKTVRVEDVDIKIDQSYAPHPPSPQMFKEPADWSMSGDVFLPSLSWWNEPGHWSGCITTLTSNRQCSLGSVTTLSTSGPAQNLAFAANGDNAYDITVANPLRLTLSGGAPDQEQRLTLVLREPVGHANPAALPTNVIWVGDRSPSADHTVYQNTVATFLTVDGGKTYFGWID